jgi:hypothetical protein
MVSMDAQPVGGVALLAVVVTASVLGPERLGLLWRRLGRGVGRLRTLRATPESPPGRPIELIARDAQRLGLGFRHVQDGVSFARFEGRRRAYDEVLAEACAALGVEHLLGVLPPGVELDGERQRVERVLERAGLRLDDAA